MEDQFLFLNTNVASQVCRVHPVALLSILDHFMRRNESQHRVIGTLLGVHTEGAVEVRNCFPVPHNETSDKVAVDMEFHRTMLDLHQRVNPKEVIVGWYATGDAVTDHSVLIHEFYGREVNGPVHLLVDTNVAENLSCKAFVSASLSVADKALGSQFQLIKCEVKTFEAEKIGINALIKSREDRKANPNNTLLPDLENLEGAVQQLLGMLENVTEYVDDVVAGKKKGDNAIGRYLSDALASIPRIDPAAFDKMFSDSLQDLLMVVYLGSLTRTQLALTEKLQTML